MAYIIEPPIFKDRSDAGRRLAERLVQYQGRDVVVLAIPRGGIPVAVPIAEELAAPLDVIVVRRIVSAKAPDSSFGAVTPDGTIVYNEVVMARLGLSEEEVEALANQERIAALAQQRAFRPEDRPLDLRSKIAILVDDGLNTGFSMLAAIRAVRQHSPAQIIVAVPISSASAIEQIAPLVDDMVCLVVHRTPHFHFSIALYYSDQSLPSDSELVRLLRRA